MGSSWPPHGVCGPAAQQLCLSLPPPSVDGAASSGLRGRSEGPRAACFLTLTSGALGNPFPLFLSGSDPEQAPCKPSPRTRRLDVPAVLSMFVGGRACWRPGGVSEWGGPGALRWGRAERGVGPVQRPEGRGGEPGPWSEALRVRGQRRLRAGGEGARGERGGGDCRAAGAATGAQRCRGGQVGGRHCLSPCPAIWRWTVQSDVI